MASLVEHRDYRSFMRSVILPMVFHGFGSIPDLLSLKMHEITELNFALADEDVVERFGKTCHPELFLNN